MIPRVALLAALCGLSTASVARAQSLVLAPLQGPAIAEDREEIGRDLRAQLGKLEGVRVISARDTEDSVVASAALSGPCDLSAVGCLSRLGAVAAVSLVVGGTVAPEDGALRVRLVLVRSGAGEVRRETDAVPRGGPERAVALEKLVIRLVNPQAGQGELEIVTERGAAILLDGRRVGTAPLAPLRVEPGEHTVEIVAPGFESVEHRVTVVQGGRAHLAAPLVRERAAVAPTASVRDVAEPKARSPRRARRVAFLGLRNDGDDARVVDWLKDALTEELRKRDRVEVMDWAAVEHERGPQEAVALTAQLLRCADDRACANDVASVLRATDVITGVSSAVGRRRTVQLWSFDVVDANEPYGCRHELGVDERTRLVAAAVACADDLLPDTDLRPDKVAGVSEELWYRIKPPPIPAPLTVTTGAVSVLAVLAAGGLASVALFALDDQPARRSSVAVLAAASAGAALGAGALTLVMLPWTDWGPPDAGAP